MIHRTAIVAAAVLLVFARLGFAEAVFREDFEQKAPTWRDAGGDASHRLVGPKRIQGEAHAGSGCEYVQVVAANGTYVYISHEVGDAAVIPELTARLWIKADRPGVQLLARVVLPRTEDPRTGGPLSVMIRGDSYGNVGAWQQLVLTDAPTQLARQVRVLRAQLGRDVDLREAYVDRLMLNVYGGQGQTRVWIDDLELEGHIGHRIDPQVQQAAATEPAAAARMAPASVRLQGSILLVDERPFFPRIIQHRGESLSLLQSLGFNTIHLVNPPTPEMANEAARLNLWFVCPPPSDVSSNNWRRAGSGSTNDAAGPEIGPLYDRVLAWDLGQNLALRDLESTIALAGAVRAADRRISRPIICNAEAELKAYSRHVDLLLDYRMPLGSSLELADYGTWLRERPRLARPGTPAWTVVQTQPAPRVTAQWSAMAGGRVSGSVDHEALRLLTRTAVAAGARGILFQSDSPLDAQDADTRMRALTLSLINLELDLIEPWAAAGTFVTTATSSKSEIIGVVLQTDRARLLLPIRSEFGGQFVSRQTSVAGLTFVVPGVPEAHDVFEMSPAGVRRIRHARVAGGVSVVLGEFGLLSLTVMTQDQLVFTTLSRRAATVGHRYAELQRDLAAGDLVGTEAVDRQIAAQGHPLEQANTLLATARGALQASDTALTAGDYTAACLRGRQATAALGDLKRAHWERASAPLGSPIATPYSTTFAMLPRQWNLLRELRAARLGDNLLAGGDFESLDPMLKNGWRYFQYSQDAQQLIVSDAELVAEAADAGKLGLRMRARAVDPKMKPGLLETPPGWVMTGPVTVAPGTVVCIRGRVRIAAPIDSSVDGLMIIDSFGGEALAERIGETSGWKEFVMYRVATSSDPLTITLALTGFGEAFIDELSIRCVERQAATPQEQARLPGATVATPAPQIR